jgi:phosphohistidine phosphatase
VPVKTLYIIRHAKSSWEDPLLDDFARPLNDRGKRDAPRMAKRLREKGVLPDLMITSPARRALGTCKRMAEILDYKEDKIKMDRGLYHANEQNMLEVLHSIKDKHDAVMVFGHNPGLTSFVNALGKQQFDNVPTCGIAAFEIPINAWKDLEFGKGNLLFYDYPKKGKS